MAPKPDIDPINKLSDRVLHAVAFADKLCEALDQFQYVGSHAFDQIGEKEEMDRFHAGIRQARAEVAMILLKRTRIAFMFTSTGDPRFDKITDLAADQLNTIFGVSGSDCKYDISNLLDEFGRRPYAGYAVKDEQELRDGIEAIIKGCGTNMGIKHVAASRIKKRKKT